MDICFIPHCNGNVIEWTRELARLISAIVDINSLFVQATGWIRSDYCSPEIQSVVASTLKANLPSHWSFAIHHYNTARFGDIVAAHRTGIQLYDASHQIMNHGDAFQPIRAEVYPSLETCIAVEQQNTCDDTVLSIPNDAFQMNNDDQPLDQFESRPFAQYNSIDTGQDDQKTSCVILDREFPGREPQESQGIFGHRFGIPFLDKVKQLWFARELSTQELLHMYSITTSQVHNQVVLYAISQYIDKLIPCSLPYQFRSATLDESSRDGHIQDYFCYGEDALTNSVQCLITSAQMPTVLNWKSAAEEDADMSKIIAALEKHKPTEIPPPIIKDVNMGYQKLLREGHLQMLHGRLVLYKPILMESKSVTLIVVPQSLRHTLFDHFHSGPSGGHMGEYKTLFRMRLRFFWPKMRQDIKNWVACCAHCVAYNTWRSRKSELYFSWPITVPFWIIHVDLWSPGHISNDKGAKGYLLNCMDDLTQFVVSSPTYDVTAHNLAQLFMSDVILSFGMCAVVVVDEGSNFKSVFVDMCTALNITCWTLARGNHKGNSCERYHRFLNKTQTINGGNRGTHTGFAQNAKTSQYAWNSAPIDNTDVTRSMAAVGREFRFPLDVDLSVVPPMNDSSNSALYSYLRNVSNDFKFSQSVLQVLIEERRDSHRERANTDKLPSAFKVGDVVKAHVQVQSKSETGVVKKLSYQARGPFQIVEDRGNNSFAVQRYKEPSSAIRKYKATELYLLPPALFPSDPLDTMDERYLNYEHAPVVSPLQKPLGIELLNDQWFDPSQSTSLIDLAPHTINHDTDKPSNTHIPTLAELNNDVNNSENTPAIEISKTSPRAEQDTLPISIAQSKDKLIFIRFTPDSTLRPRWYLIQIDMASTKEINPSYEKDNIYYCSFLAKHPTDKNKSDEFGRWWPDWYRYSKWKTSNDIIYGQRTLLAPHIVPDSTKFIQWATTVKLTADDDTILYGPFDFQAITTGNRTRSKVDSSIWKEVYDICISQNILPPTTGATRSHLPRLSTKKSKKRKRK